MKNTITEKLLKDHLLEGSLEAGEEIGLKVDQTLTQDATGRFSSPGRPSTPSRLELENLLHPPHLAVLETHFYPVRMGSGVCENLCHDSFGESAATLVLLEHYGNPLAGLDVASISSVHARSFLR